MDIEFDTSIDQNGFGRIIVDGKCYDLPVHIVEVLRQAYDFAVLGGMKPKFDASKWTYIR